jgi:hypothetical protein
MRETLIILLGFFEMVYLIKEQDCSLAKLAQVILGLHEHLEDVFDRHIHHRK